MNRRHGCRRRLLQRNVSTLFVVGGCADRNADVDLAKLRRCLLEIVELTSWDFLREGGDVHQERESKWEREYPPNKERDSE